MSSLFIANTILGIACLLVVFLIFRQLKEDFSYNDVRGSQDLDTKLGMKALPIIRVDIVTYQSLESLADKDSLIIQAYVRKVLQDHVTSSAPNG